MVKALADYKGRQGERRVHKALWKVLKRLDSDFEPYGKRPDEERGGDCSCSCRWFLPVEKVPCDWGVCANPKSPRAGLLTWEHQGCPQYEWSDDPDEE